MRLHFFRHGIASDPRDWPGSDEERPLTRKGRNRVRRIGQTLATLKLDLRTIVTSPAVRARQTAELVARELGVEHLVELEPQLLPGFNCEKLAEIIRAHPTRDSLLLVGHEPDFSAVIGALIGGGRIECKKASLIRVDLAPGRALEGTLVWSLPPRFLTRH